jgi:hypothetical protein
VSDRNEPKIGIPHAACGGCTGNLAAPVSEEEGSEGRALPPLDPEKCDPDIYRVGVSMGPFIMERRTADALVLCLRAETGWAWDWNFAAGRVVLRYLKPRAPAPPPSTGDEIDWKAVARDIHREAREFAIGHGAEDMPSLDEYAKRFPRRPASPSPRAQTGTDEGEPLVDALLDAATDNATCPEGLDGDCAREHLDDVNRARTALIAELRRLRSAALRREERDLAPYYLADGSTVMLPAAEVERLRKAAAKVIEAARQAAPDWLPETLTEADPVIRECLPEFVFGIVRLRSALDALSSPATNPEVKP